LVSLDYKFLSHSLIVQQEKDGFLFWPIKEEKKISNGWKHAPKM
jgi:hypothetical protein